MLALGSGVIQYVGSSIAAGAKPRIAVQPCTPNLLKAMPIGALAPLGTSEYLVALENVSTSNCALEGYPQLRMFDEAAKAIPIRVAHRGAFAGRNATGVTLITVKPGWSGLFALSYPNSTDYPPASCPVSNRVEIRIPNMKEPIATKWRIRPYGGKSGTTPVCGEVSVSYVYGPQRLTKSQLTDAV